MKQKTFNEIEEMYRSFPRFRDKLLLLTPKNTQFLSFAPGGGDGESKVEKIALARAEIQGQLKIIRRCLNQLTRDERLFVEYRYIQDSDMSITIIKMGWSESEVYRLRRSVLAKTRWFLSVSDSKNEQKCS
jgi:DNA-directed RNA polymerase specialized sigma subunit